MMRNNHKEKARLILRRKGVEVLSIYEAYDGYEYRGSRGELGFISFQEIERYEYEEHLRKEYNSYRYEHLPQITDEQLSPSCTISTHASTTACQQPTGRITYGWDFGLCKADGISPPKCSYCGENHEDTGHDFMGRCNHRLEKTLNAFKSLFWRYKTNK